MSILFSTFVVEKERDTYCLTFKTLSAMAYQELTRDELLIISSVLEDITIGYEEALTGGMNTGSVYLTPNTCNNLANILKKINESLYDNATIYKRAYRRYRKCQKSK